MFNPNYGESAQLAVVAAQMSGIKFSIAAPSRYYRMFIKTKRARSVDRLFLERIFIRNTAMAVKIHKLT